MDITEKISRFESLVLDDPENDMAHFALAGALNQAGRFAEAAAAYERCCELNPSMSKAYQMAGSAHMAALQTEQAKRVLLDGLEVARDQGDRMPEQAIIAMLEQLEVELPPAPQRPAQVEAATPAPAAPPASGADAITCHATGRPGTRMARPPFRGGVGTWIHEHISRETFDEWIGLGTKIINELRLDLSRDEHDAVYDYAMRRYLKLDDATYRSITDGQDPPAPGEEFRRTVDEMLGRVTQLEQYQGEGYRRLGDG